MVILLICAACLLSALAAFLSAVVLGRLSELDETLLSLLVKRQEREKPDSGFSFDGTSRDEKALFEQRLWEEGIANLLAYMGCKKDGESL